MALSTLAGEGLRFRGSRQNPLLYRLHGPRGGYDDGSRPHALPYVKE